MLQKSYSYDICFTILNLLSIVLNTFGQVDELLWEDNFDKGKLDLGKLNIEAGTRVSENWSKKVQTTKNLQ